ncbi:class I SAM-dependent methyltransferase [Erythrobacter mangrovi]|uniref:Class I SAM-dependent methyltransferase n=1 Tax=Erythrobacter mangrovi TaxID=2739433 RepID=A0A7D3XBC1_9SPHN|nr:class I SAM-dependent methyltransferase [Erythrobacter mangrovi]QKG72415.1 class I SAM-dependent methyltransferase [Erythrobacter mangrovi]
MRYLVASCFAAALLASTAPAAAQESHPNHGLSDQIPNVILGPSEDGIGSAQAAKRMESVLAAPRRDKDRVRDVWRHPAETLAFFQVEPGMTVVDYIPGGGWYTRILAPYLGPKGLYIGLTPDPRVADSDDRSDYYTRLPGRFREGVPGWSLAGAPVAIYGSQELPAALKGQVDRVLIFREMHNMLRTGVLYAELVRMRELLAEDGLLGIVQHRAKADAPSDYTLGGNGYMRERDVIALVEAHGFELVESSEINANPRDTADHEGGVWRLAPVWSGRKAELKDIGESDRMTLLFRKR